MCRARSGRARRSIGDIGFITDVAALPRWIHCAGARLRRRSSPRSDRAKAEAFLMTSIKGPAGQRAFERHGMQLHRDRQVSARVQCWTNCAGADLYREAVTTVARGFSRRRHHPHRSPVDEVGSLSPVHHRRGRIVFSRAWKNRVAWEVLSIPTSSSAMRPQPDCRA